MLLTIIKNGQALKGLPEKLHKKPQAMYSTSVTIKNQSNNHPAFLSSKNQEPR